MPVQAHIDALKGKHAALEAQLADQSGRPRPDDAAIADLKKKKLQLKEEMRRVGAA